MDQNESKKNIELSFNDILNKWGENFCSAPFNSFHIGPNGDVSTCCKSRSGYKLGNINDNDLDHISNSENSKKLRKSFLEKHRIDACKSCWDYEDTSKKISNVRTFCTTQGSDNIMSIVSNTDSDGYMKVHEPVWLDLLWTNKCNFACLGCKPEISSTIAKKYRAEFSILHPYRKNSNTPDVWTNNSSKLIDYVIKHSNTLKLIHFNGGEPFLSEGFYDLLEELVKRNLQNKIKIWSHTNGSITKSYKGVDIIEDYLVKWGRNCQITISNDGFEKRGEYIRYGYKDSKWLETFNKIKENNISVNVQSCINIFNILNIEEWINWLREHCIVNNTFIGTLTHWDEKSVSVNLVAADEEYKNIALEKLSRVLSSKNYPPNWQRGLEGSYNSIKNSVDVHQDKYILEAFDKGVTAFDSARGTSFEETFPELIKFREKIRNIYTN